MEVFIFVIFVFTDFTGRFFTLINTAYRENPANFDSLSLFK